MTYEDFESRRMFLIKEVKSRIAKINSIAPNPDAAWEMNKRNRDIVALLEHDPSPMVSFTTKVMKESRHPLYQNIWQKVTGVQFDPVKLYLVLQKAGYLTVTPKQTEFLGNRLLKKNHLVNFMHNAWLASYIGKVE
ncbi:hypothetical protein [Yersinia phage MHG19]|nr:hypothetical protein [Yersinia phage MHG19]